MSLRAGARFRSDTMKGRMPPVEILMPELGESVHEGTVSRWLKNVGDFVKEDEPVVEIMTDKVNTELPSPASGILTSILIPEGDPVEVFKAMGVITPEGEAQSAPAAKQPKPESKSETSTTFETKIADNQFSSAVFEEPVATTTAGKAWFSPVVRSIAKQHGISDAQLSEIKGSGSGGRVNKKDVEAFLATGGKSTAPISTAPPAKRVEATVAGADQTLVPLVGMRKMIAEAMVRSSQVPTVSTTMQIDVTNMVRFREANKEGFQQTYGAKLTYTPFFIKALTEALVEYPMLNASLRDDNQIVMTKGVHMGVAVSLGAKGDEGLIVPVIRNCESKSIPDIARELETIAAKARSNQLGVADVQGGTFTLTNPGSYGALFGTPMINAPQAGIGGAYGIQKVPVVIDDMIAIRSVMYFVLTYDHRIIDGGLAGKFLQSVKKRIEAFEFFK